VRARALVLGILSSTAVLAVGWQLGTQGETQPAPDAVAASTAGTSTPGTPTVTPDATSTPAPSASASAAATAAPAATPTPTVAGGVSGTFTGTSVQTRFGPVQVQITVADGTITDVTALQLTDKDQRSVSISNRAAPVLRQEVLTAQSANVQGVSGATYTSDGYLSSLQSALDQAGL
jgi:uncharacterized protein with FMN-binding domain